MALFINCSSCHQSFKIPENAATRIDLEKKLGEYFRKTCLHCCTEQEYHVNDVTAESDYTVQLVSMGVGLGFVILVTLFAWGKGVITNVGLIIGGMIMVAGWKAGNAPSSFNRYRTTRSRDESRNQQIRKEMKYTKGDSNFKHGQ